LDLDQGATSSPSAQQTDPKLPASLDGFTGVWVDDQRLYWLHAGSFQSCLKADCKHKTITYATNAWRTAVAGGRVYWQLFDGTFVGCPAEGCAASPVMLIRDDSVGSNNDVPAFAADQRYFYWGSLFDIYRCPVGGCEAVPEVLARNARVSFLVVDETHAYWPESGGIRSAPIDGSETPKLLVSSTSPRVLAVSAGYLYWPVASQVFRCPTAGCGDSPATLVVTGESEISVIKVQDNTMYWLAANTIHSCQLPGCEEPQLFTPPTVSDLNDFTPTQSFAVDATDVYWLDGQSSTDYRSGKAIRRAPR